MITSRSNNMGSECREHGEVRVAYKILSGKPEMRR
jgi:hypothetical protein